MALGTTNIAFATVKALLGDATDNYFLLCTSNKINKWSKYKPVRDAGVGSHWPASDVGNYGLNVPTNWNYLQPRGGSPGGSPDEPARLDDFRGYEHDRTLAYPSIQCRDTDNTWNANLYPSGSTYLNRWYARAQRSASSVIIIPSDLSLDSYYVGLKVSAGAVYYKTFGQVSDLTFAKSWNASISCEIVNWDTSPAFSNFPYHIGAVDWQLILCSTPAAAWTGSAPSNILYFTGVAVGGTVATYDTDGTNIYITSGSFTIKDWIKLEDYSLVFSPASSYQEVTIYCSTANLPAFTISDDASWITLSVYDGVTLISNPALYAPGMKVRVSVSAIPDVSSVTVYKDASDSNVWTLNSESGDVDPALARADGTVTVTSEGEDAEINVQQGYAGSTALTFTYNPSGGDDFPPSSATIEYIIKRGATQIYPSSGWATAIGQRGGDDNTINIADIGEIALNTDYAVYIRLIL